MTFVVYRESDGLIMYAGSVPEEMLKLQAVPDGCALLVDDSYSADKHSHVVDGALAADDGMMAERKMLSIRVQRNTLLSASDWTQMPDAPLTADKKAAWAAHRQALRDFPATCDPDNPVWPEMPT